MNCSCGRRAVFQTQEGAVFCMGCWNTYQSNIRESLRYSMSFINYLNDEMYDMLGFSTGRRPRLQLPPPSTYIQSAPVTLNTTNNIRVESGSHVGQINAGAILYIDRAVTSLNKVGQHDFALALQGFTQAVVESNVIAAESQKEVLDLLRALIQELTKKPADKNSSVFKLALQNIGPLITASAALAAHWDKLKILFESIGR